MSTLFDEWTGGRSIASMGTNAGATPIAFQGWHHFKEAFPPELVHAAIAANTDRPVGVLDPFGGSGTSALSAQFHGVPSTTVEVNPFLVDVINAKLAHYDIDALTSSFGRVCRRASRSKAEPQDVLGALPETFLEPGRSGRWLYNGDIVEQITALRYAIDCEADIAHQRFFRVLLGGILVESSNVVVSGKGRRYRRNWQTREITARGVKEHFELHCRNAIAEVHRFADRPRVRTTVIHGDARKVSPKAKHSLAVFSPPYPNSFDYTDVYNVELWMLGYLKDSADNRSLRQRTLSSHVQIKRAFSSPPSTSTKLTRTLSSLEARSEDLWSPWIPSMVGAYFADMLRVLDRVKKNLESSSQCWVVVGDSRYADVHVATGEILIELAEEAGWVMKSNEACRSMTSSAQQGGADLAERLLVFVRS